MEILGPLEVAPRLAFVQWLPYRHIFSSPLVNPVTYGTYIVANEFWGLSWVAKIIKFSIILEFDLGKFINAFLLELQCHFKFKENKETAFVFSENKCSHELTIIKISEAG